MRKGRFHEIDDSITRNACFFLSKGTRKRSKRCLKSVPERGIRKGRPFGRKMVPEAPQRVPKGGPKIAPKSIGFHSGRLGSPLDRSGRDLGSIWDRFGVDFGGILG